MGLAGVSFEAQLAAWIADEVGESVAIDGLRRTSAGFSRENWVFDATWAGETHALIARRDPLGSVLETDRRLETAVLRAVSDTDIPSPSLRWVDFEGARLGRPALIMDLTAGVCDGFVLNGQLPMDRRVEIAHRLYDCLADIHLVDWRAVGLGAAFADPGNRAALAAVEHWEAELRRVQLDPEPELTLVLHWLRAHAPANESTTLVHGDFKAGNVLLEGDDISAVLDWETAHLGDPREDLGWVTNPLRAGEHRIAGAWEPQDLLDRWSRRTGMSAEPDAVRWWQVLANVKLSVIVLTGSRAFVEHRLDRVHQSPVSIYRLLLDQIGA
jgi:aminoglycoside phosphotransferase (APT) family kinase protein